MKQRYEKPVLVDLGAMARGTGECGNGSSPAYNCDSGMAAGESCGQGTMAAGACAGGNSPNILCVMGNNPNNPVCMTGGQVKE